jgi:hypothetical protein
MPCCAVGLAVPDIWKECSAQWSFKILRTISPLRVSHPRRHEFSAQGYLVPIKLITPFLVHCQQIFPPPPVTLMPGKNFGPVSTTMSQKSSVISGYGMEWWGLNPGTSWLHPAARLALGLSSFKADTRDSFLGVKP